MINTTYIFIPFMFEEHNKFRNLVEALDSHPAWSIVHDEIIYMLKYVADKIDSRDKESCQCFHYKLTDSGLAKAGLSAETDFSTGFHKHNGKDASFSFNIQDSQLFCFATGVGILSFRLKFHSDDAFWISSAQYWLKKVSREKVFAPSGQCFTLLEKSKEILGSLNAITPLDFFFFANASTERANVLSLLEVKKKPNYRRELFYMRRCYHDEFVYTENEQLDTKEIHHASESIVWGISPEAAVCLVCPEREHSDFIQTKFIKNFNAQYLFMYVLLLHQKYVLYMFLTKIGIGTFNSLATLEDYRDRLYEFETDFVFSCITEVPQYQSLYDKLVDAFSLKAMYKDVHEPLISLSEVRRRHEDEKRSVHEKRTNKALLILSLLTIVSTLTDGFSLVEGIFSWFLDETHVKVAQGICVVGLGFACYKVIKKLLTLEKEQE